MNTKDIGQRPNDAVFHAETNLLLRAARSSGGTLESQSLEVFLIEICVGVAQPSYPMLASRSAILQSPSWGPTGLSRTMRNGAWID